MAKSYFEKATGMTQDEFEKEFGDVHFDVVDETPIDWRKELAGIDEPDNDEDLPADQSVLDMIGFKDE